jgi:hypothetical protein
MAFFCPVSLLYVALAPRFKEKLTRSVHFAGAGLSAANAVLLTIFLGNVWVLAGTAAAVLLIGALTRSLKRSIIFWLEMVCFYDIFALLTYIYFVG